MANKDEPLINLSSEEREHYEMNYLRKERGWLICCLVKYERGRGLLRTA